MRLTRIQLALLVVAAGCSSGSTPGTAAFPDRRGYFESRIPEGWEFYPRQPVATAKSAMVVSNAPLATDAGLEILRSGGNAVDAAVAVGFALAVVYPEAGNLGGGGYMVIRLANGKTSAIDYREIAPAAAFRDMFLDSTGAVTTASIIGGAASGVPGAVAGMTGVLARYGSMPLARVIAPAIRLASEGFIVDSALAASLAGKKALITQFAGGDVFFPGGSAPKVGSRLILRDLASTLRAISNRGAAGFYRGRVPELVAAEMQRGCPAGVPARARAARACGIMTVEDFARYRPSWRSPLRTTYRGYTLYSMPPSSSGGITVGETLNILEGYSSLPRYPSAEFFHLTTGAFQRAFVDRNALLGDPDFVNVPVARLLSKRYAAVRRRTILADRATPTPMLAAALREGAETTPFAVVDAKGNAVSATTTINSLYGSGVYVPGAGFFLNNEMDDFTSRPGVPNQFGLVQGERNAIAPGKRMLSAMSPTIITDNSGQLFLLIGGRGGPRIITSVTQVILNLIDGQMHLGNAVSAPRIHHQALPDTIRYETGGIDPETIAKLRAMGYSLSPQTTIGASVVAIWRSGNQYQGMPDPRGEGKAAGY
ncbi:MAG TPA: gamma-glutamyltransferase [Gemmatimonadaceae bacterium]